MGNTLLPTKEWLKWVLIVNRRLYLSFKSFTKSRLLYLPRGLFNHSLGMKTKNNIINVSILIVMVRELDSAIFEYLNITFSDCLMLTRFGSK